MFYLHYIRYKDVFDDLKNLQRNTLVLIFKTMESKQNAINYFPHSTIITWCYTGVVEMLVEME
jgi:hypothetical protein